MAELAAQSISSTKAKTPVKALRAVSRAFALSVLIIGSLGCFGLISLVKGSREIGRKEALLRTEFAIVENIASEMRQADDDGVLSGEEVRQLQSLEAQLDANSSEVLAIEGVDTADKRVLELRLSLLTSSIDKFVSSASLSDRTNAAADYRGALAPFYSSVYQTSTKISVRSHQQEATNLSGILATVILSFFSLVVFIVSFFRPTFAKVATAFDTLNELQRQTERQQLELQSRNEELEDHAAQLAETKSWLEVTTQNSQTAARRFEQLFQSIPVACVGLGEDGSIHEWNRNSTELYGIEAHEIFGRPMWEFFAAPDQLRRGKALIRLTFSGRVFHNVDVEIRRPDGQTRHLLTSLFPIQNAEGKVYAAIAASVDVTGRKEMEAQLKEREALMSAVFETLHEGLVVQDRKGVIVMANASAPKILGLSKEQMMGRDTFDPRWEAVDLDLTPVPGEQFPATLAMETGQPVQRSAMGIHQPNGDLRWLAINAAPMKDPATDEVSGVVVSFGDITEKMRQEEMIAEQVKLTSLANKQLVARQEELVLAYAKLEALAVTDGLTGLYNHRSFQEKLDNELRRVGHKNVSLVLIDVDNFKLYNDSFGHPAGDAVLRSVSSILLSKSPPGATVARYGGEEFVVILPELNRVKALEAAEKIRRGVEGAKWPMRRVTISLGVATYYGVGGPTQLIKAADQALYASKAAGRNQVTHFDEAPPKAA